ncbi:hypothetical protein [Streptomyces djakartensis]|uniref:hypothetical protein n=1 Tax=Streptomyces djakartensis TaxID=68193 RepID=UPI00167E20B8|nr:hypothetical protein [Streptomyces djakartensis]
MVYKSVGSAVQDLAVAAMCVRRAGELSLGIILPITISPVAQRAHPCAGSSLTRPC